MHEDRPRESWRPVSGFKGFYEVSDEGRVRSVDRVIEYADGTSHRHTGRELSPSRHPDGHLLVYLWRNNQQQTRFVHKLVMDEFVGPPPPGQQVCHGDGEPSNNRLSNLRYGTYSDNRNDSVRHGSHANAAKTRCPRGHLLEEPNLVPSMKQRGSRVCKACGRATTRTRKARLAGRPSIDFQTLSDQCYANVLAEARLSA